MGRIVGGRVDESNNCTANYLSKGIAIGKKR
jgi:hypothetical protein